jgi:hypothetical protein
MDAFPYYVTYFWEEYCTILGHIPRMVSTVTWVVIVAKPIKMPNCPLARLLNFFTSGFA